MMKWDIVPLIAALSRIAPGAGKQRVSQGVYSQPRTALRDQSIGGESDSASRESGQPGSLQYQEINTIFDASPIEGNTP